MEQTFDKLNLNPTLVEALKLSEITVPTDIQKEVIPEARENGDLIFQSETGTGKTLAYLLPLFEKIQTEKREMQAIVLVPTHELAIQVIRVIEMLSLNSDIKATATPIIGDVNITRQVDKLRTKPHIIVGTSGRILELIQKKKISAHTIKTIIIDEADRLLDDSNIEGTKAVIKTTLKERQIIMCSATVSSRTVERAGQFMKTPKIIKSSTAVEVPDTIDHIYFITEQRDKIDTLRKLVRIINPPKAIAFFGNGEDIAEATEKLKFHKLRADGLHGTNIKSDRKKTMDDFKSGRLQLLIASDIAARGLDIEGVTHIFNVNIPERPMEYLHRAGRTGRNGNEGVAISIVTEREIPILKQYEKELRISIIPKSMHNGVIVEYRKPRQRFETESEYGQRLEKRTDSKTVDKAARDSDSPAEKHKKAYRPDRSAAGDHEKTPFKRGNHEGGEKRFDKASKPGEKKYSRDEKQGRSYDRDDKPKKFSRDGKPSGDRFSRDGKPSDKFGRDDKAGGKFGRDDKAGGKFGRDDRAGGKFSRDDKAGGKFSRDDKAGGKFSRDDKAGGKFSRDDKAGGKFSRDGKPSGKFSRDDKAGGKFSRDGKPSGKFSRDDKAGGKFSRDDKAGGKFSRDSKPSGKFSRDDKTGGKFSRDDKAGGKFSRDGKPSGKFSRDGKPSGKFGREDRPAKKFGSEDKGEGGFADKAKSSKIKFVGKPQKNLKPWDRKPQSGQKKGK